MDVIGFFLVIAGLNHCPRSLLLSCILFFLSYCRPPSESSGVAAVPAAQRPLHALKFFRIHRRNVLRRHHLSGKRLSRTSTTTCIKPYSYSLLTGGEWLGAERVLRQHERGPHADRRQRRRHLRRQHGRKEAPLGRIKESQTPFTS